MSLKDRFEVRGECRKWLPKRNLCCLLFPFIILAVCIMMQNLVMAQETESLKLTINLKSRRFIPQMGIADSTLTKLKTNIAQEEKAPHLIIQFKDTPSRKDRESLKMRGVRLLSYIGGNAWFASVSDTVALLFMDPRITNKYSTLGLIRWIGEILPQDKIDTKIAEEKPFAVYVGSSASVPQKAYVVDLESKIVEIIGAKPKELAAELVKVAIQSMHVNAGDNATVIAIKC